MPRRAVLYALLAIAAVARLMLAAAAMPPYAGLDEIYHVARLAFVAQEHRNPTTTERSVPPYLDWSIDQRWDALPAFAIIGDRWPEVVRTNPRLVQERALTPERIRPYGRANYEAQQPSLYYAAVAPLRPGTDAGELRVFRFVAILFALLIVMAAAWMGERWSGESGILAAALIVSLPTWITLVVRAGNDAPACAFAAIALAITASGPQRLGGWIAESVSWALAIATKMYTWPVAVVVPIFWWMQRAKRSRMVIVTLLSAAAAMLVLADLHGRARNPLGVVAFDRPGGAALTTAISVRELVSVTIASAAWTSGQHWDALRPLAILIYLGPILAVILLAQSGNRWWRVTVLALATFFVAQVFNVISCVMARRAGNDITIGGKEGWYWYVLAPLVVAALVPPALQRLGRARLALILWMVAWDVIITEGALFHDYAGASSPLHPSLLFRWGPLQAPFTANLGAIGVGPLALHLIALRIVHVAALVALFVLTRISGSAVQPSALEEFKGEIGQNGVRHAGSCGQASPAHPVTRQACGG
jgi:hypothetical protein